MVAEILQWKFFYCTRQEMGLMYQIITGDKLKEDDLPEKSK